MFCPSCGKEIPDESQYCLACGKSPTAGLAKYPPPQTKSSQSHTLRNIVIGFFAIIGVLFVLNKINDGQLSPALSTHREPIISSPFTVGAGQMYYVRFNVPKSARLVGRFQVAGGSGNDAEAIITDEDSFENWKNGHQPRVLYQSGKVTVGNIDVPITQTGTYYIAFNNQFSVVSSKTVNANITLQY